MEDGKWLMEDGNSIVIAIPIYREKQSPDSGDCFVALLLAMTICSKVAHTYS